MFKEYVPLIAIILTALGGGGLLKTFADSYIARRLKKQDELAAIKSQSVATSQANEKARIEDSAALRSEIWDNLTEALERNADLARQLGEEIQKKAHAEATSGVMEQQNKILSESLSRAVTMRDEAEQRLQKRHDEYDVLRSIHSDFKQKLDDCVREVNGLRAELHKRRLNDE